MYAHGPKSAFESETFGDDLSFHIEQPVGSMSISPCGRDVALASKEGLHVIDLDSPYSPPRYLPHRTPWEVADVQWSPFSARDFWVISTSNQKALVWNLGLKSQQNSVEFVLHAHSRAITDINFSAHHPDVLATCAVDSFVHCWDLRVPARPVVSFSDWFAGATQVKWNRQESHVIASSHDKHLRIWDDRMGAYPVRSIEAHGTKIYGIDWNRSEQNRIVTCSLDRSVKFWNIGDPDDVPEQVINTPFPAWRARHTPFGRGLLAMPQRGNGDLHLYDCRPIDWHDESGPVPTVARFYGHKHQVKEFLWRPRGSIVDDVDHREFQLVSWGTDQELRLHRMKPEILSAVGYQRGVTQVLTLNVTRAGARYKTFRDEPSQYLSSEAFDSRTLSSSAGTQSFLWRSQENPTVGMSRVAVLHPQGWLQGRHSSSHIGMHGKTDTRPALNPIDWMKNVKITSWNSETLGEEISQVGEKFAKVAFEFVDVRRRKAVISLDAPWGNLNAAVFMKVDIKFPTTYPGEAAAVFKVQKTAAMTDDLAATLSTELRTIAEVYVVKRRGCLESVLRYLLREQSMEQTVAWIMEGSLEHPRLVDDIHLEGEISSDEDDVGIQNFQLPAGLNASLDIPNANVLVPVPNGCGGRWADNGKLVCFFPARSRPPVSFLGLLGTRNTEVDKSEKVFEGFGRMKSESPGARKTLRTMTSGEDQTSDFSDGSSFSSSSSSASSENLVSLPTRFFPRDAWRAGGAPLHRARSTDYSMQSALGASKPWHGAEYLESTISIHDTGDMMPPKLDLAKEYIIFGNGSHVCDHNAAVAIKLGHEDIAHVWLLMKLILEENVPLESITLLHGSSDIVTIARSVTSAARRGAKGLGNRLKLITTGRVRWGESAFGGDYLVPALIGYFERRGDIQMLAMLSCIFTEEEMAIKPGHASRQHQLGQASRYGQTTPTIDYHASVEVARSVARKASTMSYASGNSATKTQRRAALVPLTDGNVYSKSPATYSTGTTPPDLVRQHSRASSDKRRLALLASNDMLDHNLTEETSANHPAPSALSTSPDEARSARQSNSGRAFSITRAGLSTFAPSFSRSPPVAKSSPVGSFIAQHMNAGGRSAANISVASAQGKYDLGAQTARSRRSSAHPVAPPAMPRRPQSVSFDGEALERLRSRTGSTSLTNANDSNGTVDKAKVKTKPRRKIKITSTLHNQDMFDEEGYAKVPLLDPVMDWKYRSYRARYAHLLGVWDFYIQRAEILKFGAISDDSGRASRDPITDLSVAGDKIALENRLRQRKFDVRRKPAKPKPGPELRRRCAQCNHELTPIEKNGVPIGWNCIPCSNARGKKSATFTLCTICRRSIAGLMVPCLNCGHATCFPCQRRWLARESRTNDLSDEDPFSLTESPVGKPCAAGCGCVCSSHDCVAVPTPPPSDHDQESVIEEEQQIEKEDALPLAHRHPTTSSATPEPTPTTTYAPDSALEAIRSLSTRGRSASDRDSLRPLIATNTAKTSSTDAHHDNDNSNQTPHLNTGDGINAHYDISTDTWSRYGNIGRGFRAGLTRTAILRERDSDATIRKRSESEAGRT